MRLFYVSVVLRLRRADHSSKESYRLWKMITKLNKRPGPNKGLENPLKYIESWKRFVYKHKILATYVLRHSVFELCMTVKSGNTLLSSVTFHDDIRRTVRCAHDTQSTHSRDLAMIEWSWNPHTTDTASCSWLLAPVIVELTSLRKNRRYVILVEVTQTLMCFDYRSRVL
jgi:hypothetical protein